MHKKFAMFLFIQRRVANFPCADRMDGGRESRFQIMQRGLTE